MTENTGKITDEMVENLKRPSAWLRVLFMAGFVVALYITGVILMVLTLAQIIFSLLTGSANTNLRGMGASLTTYVNQILLYLTYNSEIKPFPFLPFPVAEDVAEAEFETEFEAHPADEVVVEEVVEEVVIVEEHKPRPDAQTPGYKPADE